MTKYEVVVEREACFGGADGCQQRRVVVAALFVAFAVQRYGDDDVGLDAEVEVGLRE